MVRTIDDASDAVRPTRGIRRDESGVARPHKPLLRCIMQFLNFTSSFYIMSARLYHKSNHYGEIRNHES